MPTLEDPKAKQNPNKTGTSNPTQKKMLLKGVRDCLIEKPAHCTRLSKGETHVYKLLYVTV